MVNQQIKYDIFISYSTKQKAFVRNELAPKLRLENFTVWVDTEIPDVIRDWRSEIDRAIDESRVVIVVMTPDANKSEYVTFEWSYAMGKEKPMILLMRQPTPKIHPRLNTMQYIEFNDNHHNWSDLFTIIRAEIEKSKEETLNYVSKNDLITVLREWVQANELALVHTYDLVDDNLLTIQDIIKIKHKE